MPKSICVKCEVEIVLVKNGIFVIEMFLHPPQPYKIWSADLWECPTCQHQTVVGFGVTPLAEHFEDKFPAILERAQKSKFSVTVYEKGNTDHE